jgi:lipoprotein-anchoring transpeptidase ErfK/SrfK
VLRVAVFLLSLYLFAGADAGTSRKPPMRSSVRQTTSLGAEAINDTSLTKLVTERSSGAAVIRAQILLGRANFSVGEIDGSAGINFRRSVIGFQNFRAIAPSGIVDQATWKALNVDSGPAIVPYRITKDDLAGAFEKIPSDMMEQAKLTKLGYQSVDEKLGERFHSSPALLHKLNSGKQFGQPDTEIMVPNVVKQTNARADSVVVSKSLGTVIALDGEGKVIAQYPTTTGSDHDPLPIGDWRVIAIVHNPWFFYNPELFWDADPTQAKARIAPGPRNPVGVVWIGISKENYGIHGTPEPSSIGHTQSHGCVRLTNWDATELARMVVQGTPVLFKE